MKKNVMVICVAFVCLVAFALGTIYGNETKDKVYDDTELIEMDVETMFGSEYHAVLMDYDMDDEHVGYRVYDENNTLVRVVFTDREYLEAMYQ